MDQRSFYDVIESIANTEPLQNSYHFYAGIAWILMEADDAIYAERAVEHFQKALELKPGSWVAMEGLARCYGDVFHGFETAIQCMEDARRSLPQTEDFGVKIYLEARIPGWLLQLGNDQESVGRA